jgi:hypothetical protein
MLVYLWAGLHKLNVHHLTQIFPWVFFTPRNHALALLLRSQAINGSGVGVVGVRRCTLAFLEARSSLGIYLAVSRHVIILVLIGPLGMNSYPGVWAWNVRMAAWVVVLFWEFAFAQSAMWCEAP